MDGATADGGGEVRLAAGTFVVGTLRLRSRVTLHLEAGARLMGSPDIARYDPAAYRNRYLNEPHMDRCLLYAEGERDVSIVGQGALDGNKHAFPNIGDPARHRPMLIRMVRCENVHIDGVKLIDAASWTTAFHQCGGVFVTNAFIKNTPHPVGNGDGLDFDACRNVLVSNCFLDTSDDCICLQSSYPGLVCSDVTVTNCVMTGTWAGMRIGLASLGDIRNVAVSNLVMRDLGCSGLKIQSTEGGALEDMSFSNIVMRNVPRAVFTTLNHLPMTVDAPADIPHTGHLRRMRFSGISLINDEGLGAIFDSVRDLAHGVVVAGEPGSDIEDLSFEDISLLLEGGGAPDGLPVEELTGLRPEFFVYRHGLPAGAMYFRHVRNIAVRGARIAYRKPERRPDILCEDGEVSLS
jgi:hypothetical protein